jgi:hypothetical protein
MFYGSEIFKNEEYRKLYLFCLKSAATIACLTLPPATKQFQKAKLLRISVRNIDRRFGLAKSAGSLRILKLLLADFPKGANANLVLSAVGGNIPF